MDPPRPRASNPRKSSSPNPHNPHVILTESCHRWLEWASLVSLPTTDPILEQIFGGLDNYAVAGMGGEIALPGAMEYQRLHQDGAEPSQIPGGRFDHAASLADQQGDFLAAAGNSPLGGAAAAAGGAEADPESLAWQRRAIEMTPGLVTINFLVSDMTTENGPIRQIPGSHTSTQPIPKPADEPPWMRYSTLVGAKAGAAIFRDNRCWHGATPNVSKEIRALPNIEYVPAWKKPQPHGTIAILLVNSHQCAPAPLRSRAFVAACPADAPSVFRTRLRSIDGV